jgi:hypothetical protein
MVQTKGHNTSTLTLVGRLYKKERMVKKKCLCSPYQIPKVEEDSKEEEPMILM